MLVFLLQQAVFVSGARHKLCLSPGRNQAHPFLCKPSPFLTLMKGHPDGNDCIVPSPTTHIMGHLSDESCGSLAGRLAHPGGFAQLLWQGGLVAGSSSAAACREAPAAFGPLACCCSSPVSDWAGLHHLSELLQSPLLLSLLQALFKSPSPCSCWGILVFFYCPFQRFGIT